MNSAKGPALSIMARAPRIGEAKTRLQPHLVPEQSAKLYLALLRDALELAMSVKGICKAFLAFTPIDAEEFFKHIVPPSVELLPQSDGDIGEKMLNIFRDLGQIGYSPVVVIGSDIPTLQPMHIEKALESLNSSDVCLGPSRDGGYYLVGAKEPHSCLFEGISWSTSQVFEMTVKKTQEAGLSVALIDVCSDVDTVEDLRWLRQEIERLKHAEDARIPKWTDACLKEIGF